MITPHSDKQNTLYIVGKRVKKLMKFRNVITYSEFIQLASITSKDIVKVIIGQGLSHEEIHTIFLITKLSHNYIINNSYQSCPEVANCLTHKHEIKNVLVSVPQPARDGIYMSYLCINENCAELSDHLTGYHIPGFLLIEAARQMVTAITEKFLKPEGKEFSFVLKELSVDFRHYVFYGEVKMCYKLVEIRHGLNGSFSANSQVNFMQNEIVVTSMNIKHQLMDKATMDKFELDAAKKCLEIV